MSQHHYTGPVPRHSPALLGALTAWALALVTVGLQIWFPLVAVGDRVWLTTVTVIVFFLAGVVHASVYRGWVGFVLVGLVIPLVGFAAEYSGIKSGWPFGDYAYTDVLRPAVLGVPVVAPLAWAMMAYPTFVAASHLAHRRWVVALIGGWSLMAWDIFLEPMMIELNAWTWKLTEPSLPGLPGVPLLNYAGWFVVGTSMVALLTMLPRERVGIAQPAALYLWVYISSVVGGAVFFERPEVALIGGVAMGVVALPFAWRLWEYRG